MDQSQNRTELYENIPQSNSPIKFCITDANNPFPIHWHEHIEIHYVIEGEVTFRCENDTVTVPQNTFLVVNSNELHQGLGGTGRRFYLLLFPEFFEKNNLILKRVIKDAYLSELANKMIAEYNNSDDFSKSALKGYAYLILAHLCRHCVYESFDNRSWSSYSQRILGLNKAIKFIDDHYQTDISLDELSKISNFNKYYFCNIFKEYTGMSFKDYQTHIRIQKAKDLLFNTDLPVTQIAFQCGFNDSNYFARKFKKSTGKTPREIRQTSES